MEDEGTVFDLQMDEVGKHHTDAGDAVQRQVAAF
jgi:hypothetical protein